MSKTPFFTGGSQNVYIFGEFSFSKTFFLVFSDLFMFFFAIFRPSLRVSFRTLVLLDEEPNLEGIIRKITCSRFWKNNSNHYPNVLQSKC